MIEITSQQIQQIYHHAERTYPEECCGLLLGYIEEQRKVLVEVRETENSWNPSSEEVFGEMVSSGSKKNRFSIAPETLLQIEKETRDRSLKVIGIYHSHPDHHAIPSEFDRAIAWPDYSYLIVSVQKGIATNLNIWQLDQNHQFQTETICKSCNMI